MNENKIVLFNKIELFDEEKGNDLVKDGLNVKLIEREGVKFKIFSYFCLIFSSSLVIC